MSKLSKVVFVVLIVLIITGAIYLTTLETRKVSYQESYQEPVYKTETWQEPVYKTEYYQEPVYKNVLYTESVPYEDTVSSSRSLKNNIRKIECHGNAHHWYGDETGHAIYEVINTDTVGGDFTVSIKMTLSGGSTTGNQMTKYIAAGSYAFFEYKLYIPESVTCEGNVISALSTETNVVTKYNNVQKSKQDIDYYETKSKQVFDHYETKSKQVFDYYETKYMTKYKNVTKMRYQWYTGE